MKSYNHLYEIYISDENLELAKKNALKRRSPKKKKRILKRMEEEYFDEEIKNYARNFHNAKHKPREIYDGIQRKKRTIIVPTPDEQIVHHMVVNVLKPIFMKGMYEHSYGSVPGRGGYGGMKTLKKWIAHGGKNVKYCLKMDIRHYFESIPHDILLKKLRALIHDERFMVVLEEIINATDKGIPLGFYTSQWLANWYLQGLDHYIKEDLGAKYYIRYMDDMVIFGPNKRALHRVQKEIERYLNEKLGLEMKDNWQVFLFHYVGKNGERGRALDFMGFRFYRNRVTLRRSILLKMTRKARKIGKKEKSTIHDLRQILSYLGWLKPTDTYGIYLERVKPFVNYQYAKRRVSRQTRRKNELVHIKQYDTSGRDGHNFVEKVQLCAA